MARNWKVCEPEATMTRIQHVLCPIDFSDASRHALDHAIAMARWYKARVTVLHAHEMPRVYAAPYVGPEALEPIVLTDVERRALLDHLDTYVDADRDAAGVEIETVLNEGLNVAGAVLQYASSNRVDLITIGTHGRSGFDRLVLGSVAEKVLRKSCCPVMTVPPRVEDAVPRQLSSIQRILCAIDFSKSSGRALEYAGSLAQESGARLTVLHVVDVPSGAADLSGLTEFRAALFRNAHGELSRATEACIPEGVAVDDLLLAGTSYKEILRVAADQDAGLIVMGVQGRGAIDMALFGSTTNHVVREATCPVLTLRARP
jgi:nucleotide-binding universal stress UspA family protein